MKKLSQESIKRYNEEWKTNFEFVEVVKANFHFAAGYIFLITFDVLDPSDNQKKTFQARIYYSSCYPTEYVFVRPKPDSKVNSSESSGGSSEENVSSIRGSYLLYR
uniref:Cystatin domain-containing protein n=1 Tax=Noccaea caerulescens TaxID=107243 RepID=A0A1J3FSW5_NOCCA